MNPRFRFFGISLPKTFHSKLFAITATVMLAVAVVVVSVHSSSSPASKAEATNAKSSESSRAPQGQLKTNHGGAVRNAAPLAPPATTVTATKADSLFTDVDGDLQADPGDTLKYTVNINASGGDATGLTFTDTVDPNTAFVPGSLTATPVAVDDSYTATGNIRISVAAPGVLGNDFNGVPGATITGAPSLSANGGDLSLAADGSFTYNPPAGFEGTDTFTYTLTNAVGTNNATVSINVSGMIWFIDNNAASCTTLAAGCGRLTNPFSSLSAFAALNNGAGNNPAANDNIFVYESAIDYVGPVTLLSGQRFIGQDATASLSAITGLTPPAGSDPLPATNSANGTIVNITGGNAITVASGNTLTGFTGGNATTDITGTGFGTLTISDVTLNGTGQALNLSTGTLAATFGSISSANSGTTGITLSGVAGSLTTPSTTITNSTGIGLSVGTSSTTLNFGATAATGSAGTGVSLLTNTGTITFSTLDIAPVANQRGLLATDNTNTITSTGGAISTSGAIAVEITRAVGTTPLVISQTSIAANGGTNGIVLSNTSGSFTVTGNTGGICGGQVTAVGGGTPATVTAPAIADCSGGTIQSTTSFGISLNNATNVSLTRMRVTGGADDGISGSSVNGFALTSSAIQTNGNAVGEAGIDFTNLAGACSITNSAITGSAETHLHVINTTGVLSGFTITGSQFSGTSAAAPGNDGVRIEPGGTANVTASISNSFFSNNRDDQFQMNPTGTATSKITLDNNTFSDNTITTLGGGITINPGSTNTTTTAIVTNNDISGSVLTALNFNLGTGSPATAVFHVTATGNFIGNTGVNGSGSRTATGVLVTGNGAGTINANISNNNIRQYTNPYGIQVFSRDGAGFINATIQGNTITEFNPVGFVIDGIRVESGALAGDSGTVCANIGGAGALSNNLTTAGNEGGGGNDLRIRIRFATKMTFPGYVGGATDDTALQAYLSGRNALTTVLTTQSSTNPVPYGNGGAGCTAPSMLSMISADGNNAAKAGTQINGSTGGSAEAEDILRATQGEGPSGKQLHELSAAELMALRPAAIERWRAAGISSADLARLEAVTFEIEDLPEGQLATATSTSVKIDATAAGYGWYSDVSPMEDSEFEVAVPERELQTTEFSPAAGRMDLLTVVMRELGVAFQRDKESSLPKQMRSLMETSLSPAVRRVPDSQTIQLPSSRVKASVKKQSGDEKTAVARNRKGSTARSKAGGSKSPVSSSSVAANRQAKQAARNGRLMHHASRRNATLTPSMLADVMLNIGTLPAGESVTITFNVTVDDPFTGAVAQVSNQGTVSGSNFADVLTDDPSVGGAADPTVTPIDLPDVSVAVSPTSVAEDGATNLVYTFTRNGSTASALTVNFSVGGTASFGASPNDYTQTGAASFTPPTGTVTFGAGNATATVTIDPETDTTVEPDETVVLTVTSGIGYDVGSPSSASGTITNDDTDVSVAVSPSSVAEDGAGNLVYTFTRAGVTTSSLTVNFTVGGTATFGVSPNDYTQTGATTFTPPTGTVTFTAGSSTATVTVDPETDSTVEPDETVILTVASGTGYNVAAPSSATGTITNDDTDVSVAVSPSSVAEDGAGNLVYTFTRAGVTTNSLTVNFSVGGTAAFGVSPNDYTQTGATTFTPPTGTVTFTAGNSTATVTIDPEADTTVEPDETVDITVTAGVGYNVGSPSAASGTITNDDTDVSVAVAPASVTEDGATNLVYTFTRAGVTASSLTVNFSVGGTASFGPSPDDYTQTGATTFTASSGTVTFTAGSSTATVTVNPEADTTVEPDETVDITVTAGTGYNVASPSSATGTITNDDTDVSIAVSPASVAEDGAGNLVYTFTRAGVTTNSLTVNFSVGGTASFGVSPNDYTQTGATSFTPPTGTVTFTAGSSTATVTVNPETDTTIEADETVILTLTAGAGYNVSSPASATGTITNDDADVSVAVSPAAVAEDGATNLVYTFSRTGFTGGALTVNFSVGGTATFGVSPDDYTQTGATTFTTTTGSVTFSPGSPTATVTVDPETDTTAEADETVIITLTAGASYNAVSPSSATGTILNDDTLVSVVVSPSSTTEGGANLVYTFSRTGPTTSALAVNVSVGGTASFPADYSQSGATTFTPPTATVTFAAGSSTKTVTVTPLTDCAVEGSETVVLTVQPGTGYGVGSPSSATGTIANTPDSSAPTITLIPNVNMTLWPPNHQYETVAVTDFVASASDNCDPTVNVNSVYITKITSDEVENGNGDGNTLNDIVIGATCKTAQLRSERDGSGNGRVYTIFFKVVDSAGNVGTASTTVTVRKNPNQPAVDSGVHYTVNSICP